MKLTVDISEAAEAGLARVAGSRGVTLPVLAAQLLEDAVGAKADLTRRLSPQEIEDWLDSLTEFAGLMPKMPDETFSREMIYQDHD